MGTPGYYVGTVPEQLAAEVFDTRATLTSLKHCYLCQVRRPDLGSRVQGLSSRLSSAADDLAFRVKTTLIFLI